MRRACECGFHCLGVAVVIIERDIVWHIVIELRRAVARGFLRGNHRRQGLDIDHDGLSRVFGLRQRPRNHAGNGIADVTHAIGRQRVAPRFFQRRAIAIVQTHETFQRAVIFQIGTGIDREYAWHLRSRLGVDAANDAVRIAAANHDAIGLPRETYVVGIAPVAAHQHRVFQPRHGLSDGELFGCQSVLGRVLGPIGDSVEIHDGQIRKVLDKVLDPFEIKNLADPSNRAPNIAHRRTKHGIALFSTPVTFLSI